MTLYLYLHIYLHLDLQLHLPAPVPAFIMQLHLHIHFHLYLHHPLCNPLLPCSLHEDWLVHKKHHLPAPVLVINADMVSAASMMTFMVMMLVSMTMIMIVMLQTMAEMKAEYIKNEEKVFGLATPVDPLLKSPTKSAPQDSCLVSPTKAMAAAAL